MRGSSWTPALIKQPQICARCTYRRPKPRQWHASYGTQSRRITVNRSSSRGLLFGGLAATGIGAGSYFFIPDQIKETSQYTVAAAQRTGRVLVTLGKNIQDYRKVLKEKSSDGEAYSEALKACHKRCAERTLKAMEKNGSIFIKLGQHLSSMGYLLPSEWTTTFIPLQDHCPVSSYQSIEQMFLKDIGTPVLDIFETFDQEPIGAASLAQVHLATMKDSGRKVAVKLKRFFPEYDLEWLSGEMESSLPQELDFNIEGQNAMITKAHFANIRASPLVVPDVMWSKRRILVMDYVSGHRLDDLEYLDAQNIDRDEVSAALARVFNEMIFGDTPLHCDPHGGNIAIRKNEKRRGHNFDLILYDHGLYREIPKPLRRSYAKLWLAVIDSNEPRMRKYAYEVAGIGDDQFPLFASAITGRDYLSATKSVVSERSDREKEVISGAMGEGLLQQLVKLLGKVPRIILLILKTNDLTRSLDENLHTREGPVRNFMMLAHYCSRSVFREQMEYIAEHGTKWLPRNWLHYTAACGSYLHVELRLLLYEYYVSFRRVFRLSPVQIQSI